MRRMRTTNKEAVENTRQRRSRGARTFDVHKRVRLRSSLAAALLNEYFEQLPSKVTSRAFARCGLVMNLF